MAHPNTSMRRTRFGKIGALAAAVLATLGIMGVGLAFINSLGISQVADRAVSLHWTNATMGSSGILRASVAQAVFFSFDERLGVSSPEARDAAISEALLNLEDVQALLASPDATADSDIANLGRRYVTVAADVVTLASDGRPDEAENLRLEEFEPIFEELTIELDERQSELSTAIKASKDSNGQIARFTQLAVSLVIPGVAMVVLWLVMRRRLQKRESEMGARLLAEKQLNIAKDEFVAGLSHELRTPLTTIVGFSEILFQGGADSADAHEMLSIINSGASDLSRMVDDLLIAARIDAGALAYAPQRVDVVKQVDQVLAPFLRAGDAIRVKVPSMDVYADPLHTRQILRNLVSNASRHGGPNIIVTGDLEGSRATLVVADDGEGVAPEVEERLFERFSNRGSEAMVAGSVGLGLAISHELARGLGASIQYKRVDGWTTFIVRFKGLPRDNTEADQFDGLELAGAK